MNIKFPFGNADINVMSADGNQEYTINNTSTLIDGTSIDATGDRNIVLNSGNELQKGSFVYIYYKKINNEIVTFSSNIVISEIQTIVNDIVHIILMFDGTNFIQIGRESIINLFNPLELSPLFAASQINEGEDIEYNSLTATYVSGTGLDSIYDFAEINTAIGNNELNKNAYIGNSFGLPEHYAASYILQIYFDTNNPTHWKLKDFHFRFWEMQAVNLNRICFARGNYNLTDINDLNVSQLYIFNSPQNGLNFVNLLNYCGYTNSYLLDDIVTGNNSTFEGPGDWETYTGTPTFDINSTVASNLYIKFTSGNQGIRLRNTLTTGRDNYCEIKLRKISGNDNLIQLGGFGSSEIENSFRINHLTTEYSVHKFVIRGALEPTLYLGVVNADNNGGVYAIDYIKVKSVDEAIEKNEFEFYSDIRRDLNEANFLQNIDGTKKLFKFAVLGDSIMANFYGGTSFNDEGQTLRSPRLTVNNVPRRIYDYITANNNVWNIPTFKRIDNSDWSVSNESHWIDTPGTWLAPIYTQTGFDTKYRYSQTANAYCEIEIPNGFENCIIIGHADDNGFGQDYEDAANITLNGGSIASHGNSTFNTFRNKLSVNDQGNPYFHEIYTNLPSGTNTIRITKSNNSKTLAIWGIAYWTGNGIWLFNSSAGGNTSRELYDNIIRGQVVENDPDVVFFEFPGMNDASSAFELKELQKEFEYNFNLLNQFARNILIYSTQPFGDNGLGINFYTLFDDPNTLEEIYKRIKYVCNISGLPFIDVFDRFKELIENDGGSLEGGEGGLTYTTDGQHPNTLCAELFSSYINEIGINDKLIL